MTARNVRVDNALFTAASIVAQQLGYRDASVYVEDALRALVDGADQVAIASLTVPVRQSGGRRRRVSTP